jgi:hypothetical protein
MLRDVSEFWVQVKWWRPDLPGNLSRFTSIAVDSNGKGQMKLMWPQAQDEFEWIAMKEGIEWHSLVKRLRWSLEVDLV